MLHPRSLLDSSKGSLTNSSDSDSENNMSILNIPRHSEFSRNPLASPFPSPYVSGSVPGAPARPQAPRPVHPTLPQHSSCSGNSVPQREVLLLCRTLQTSMQIAVDEITSATTQLSTFVSWVQAVPTDQSTMDASAQAGALTTRDSHDAATTSRTSHQCLEPSLRAVSTTDDVSTGGTGTSVFCYHTMGNLGS